MNDASKITNQLRTSKTIDEMMPLLNAFEQLSIAERQAVEPQLIEILKEEGIDEFARAWVPNFLGLVGTANAHNVLMEHLPVEKRNIVRRWIAIQLARHFHGDDRINLIVQQFDREQAISNKRAFARTLAEYGGPAAIPKLIELLTHDDHIIRGRVARGLGQRRAEEAVELLAQRVAVEEDPDVSQAIIEALVTIDDPSAISALLESLRNQNQLPELRVAVLQALGQLATAKDRPVIEVLFETTCHSDRVAALTAIDVLLKLLPQAEIAQQLAQYGIQLDNPDKLSRTADALRMVGGMEAINYLQTVRGDPEENRAQTLIELIGGRQAINALVNRRMEALKQAGGRVEEFDTQALMIFNQTIGEAKRGFMISLLMSGTIFLIGVVMLGVSIYLIVQTDPTLSQQLFGAGGSIAGLGSILAMFYRGPSDRIERSVTNLVQTEIAFLGYIRQVTQITAMFEREYLDNKNFDLIQLEKILSYTERTIKETMPLVNRYTAISSDKSDREINNIKKRSGGNEEKGDVLGK